MSKVTVSARSLGPSIDRRIFGHFLENMGRSIYAGGLLDKNGRPRAEIIDKIKALHVPSLRWPGGLFADGYHWTNGIGEHRPKKRNLYWGQFGSWLGPTDLNQFGTDEFLQLCEHLGAEPYVNINFANGTPQEAADWVAYCNDRPSGISGRLRAANGHDAAYNVRVWGIGNEQYGFWAFGHTTAERYARRYLEFHHAMSEADPGITPVAVGATEMWPNWNPTVLHILQEKLRYLSMHVYLPGTNVPYLLMRLPNNAKTHYALSAAGYEMSRQIHAAADQITAEYGRETHVRLAVDEWNLWWWWLQAYKVWWTMRDAVAVGGMLGALVENCQHVAMANIAQLINVLGVIRTSPTAVVATPLYHVLEMFASTLSGFRLETREEGPKYSTSKLGGIPAVTDAPMTPVYASLDGDEVGMIVVQRCYEHGMVIELEAPRVRVESVRILSGPSPEARNDFEHPDRVRVQDVETTGEIGGVTLDMPPVSIAAVKGRVVKD